jgi:hypothetical protein
MKKSTGLALAVALVGSLFSTAHAQGSPESMMDECRARAGTVFKESFESISAKYEGQRTDGSHAVNGSARNGSETFQCSFDKKGYKITRFLVNNPN